MIEKAFNHFSDSILLIYTQKTYIDKLYNKEANNLSEVQQAMSSHSLWYDNMLKAGERTYLKHNQFELDDIKIELFKSYNRQVQWHLVSVYESFQKYMDEIYAILGYVDNASWIAKHFGDITIREIESKDLNWFRKKVNTSGRRNISTENQIKQIRKYINVFHNCEIIDVGNNLKNLYFNFILISQLRHLIVHNDGLISEKENFQQRIFDKIKDLDKNFKKNRMKYTNNIELFFGMKKYSNNIFLTNIARTKDNDYHDRFKFLTDDLLSYAKLICDILILSLKDKNL